jgi:hypothetical protein
MPLLTIARNAGSGDLSFLKPGQLLTAQVLGATSDGNLNIKINDQVLKVVSDLQLMQGTKINLKVEVKEGQLMLRLITPQDNSVQTPQQALRQVLPKQQPMQPLFTQLARIAVKIPQETTQPAKPSTIRLSNTAYHFGTTALLRGDRPLQALADGTTLPPLPPKVRQAIASLLKQLPSNEKLATPEGLKQAINNSGMFFENRLHSGGDKAALQGDLKTILFRIAFLLRQSLENLPLPQSRTPAPPQQGDPKMATQQPRQAAAAQSQPIPAKQAETQSLLQLLGRQSESALARVQMNQLTSLTSQQQGDNSVLTLELPLFNGKDSELLELQIRREAQRQGREAEACWSATLKLDTVDYGVVRAVVSLIGKQVSTTFWCEEGQTQQYFHQHLEQLRQQMEQQGLQLGRTQAFTGMPPEPDGPPTPSPDDGLFHSKA